MSHDAQVTHAIEAAENGEYEAISNIVRRGDGKLLIGRTSNDQEVHNYLTKIPKILVSLGFYLSKNFQDPVPGFQIYMSVYQNTYINIVP